MLIYYRRIHAVALIRQKWAFSKWAYSVVKPWGCVDYKKSREANYSPPTHSSALTQTPTSPSTLTVTLHFLRERERERCLSKYGLSVSSSSREAILCCRSLRVCVVVVKKLFGSSHIIHTTISIFTLFITQQALIANEPGTQKRDTVILTIKQWRWWRATSPTQTTHCPTETATTTSIL
jgi:hypothetical protein